MNNSEYTWWFVFMSLFNTNLGLTNIEKNTLQEERQKMIDQKLDKIIKLLEEIK